MDQYYFFLRINVQVRRLGSGYGAKISRACLIACATATAAIKLQQPCYVRMILEDNMECIGKRYPCSMNYEVGVNEKGKIQYCNLSYYTNIGYATNEPVDIFLNGALLRTYDVTSWEVKGYTVQTDTAGNCWMRAPGSTEAFAMLENIMEHISIELNLPGEDVRLENLKKGDDTLPKLITTYSAEAEVKERVASNQQFNEVCKSTSDDKKCHFLLDNPSKITSLLQSQNISGVTRTLYEY